MFSYKDSKLEADIKQLNSNLNKTEYEKAREPLQKQIAILNEELYKKDIALQSLYQVCKEFLHNNIKNKQIIVMKNEPHLFYGAVSDVEFEKTETIKIDLSDYKILQEFIKRIKEDSTFRERKLLRIIEKLQKENEELKADNYELNNRITDLLENIPIQKIKDIIDRIDYDIKKTKEIISNNSNIYTSDRRNDYQIVRLRAMNTKSLDIRKRLQKLLESEE